MKKVTVARLANAPKGSPYRIERIEGVSEGAAAQQAADWWESGGTIAVVVLVDGKEDARYERDYLDQDRVPEGWTSRKATASELEQIARQAAAAARQAIKSESEKPGPTIFNEEDLPREETRAASDGLFLCETCGAPLTQDRRYPEETDTSPSGRMADRRCPECGRPLEGVKHADIMAMYTRRRRR